MQPTAGKFCKYCTLFPGKSFPIHWLEKISSNYFPCEHFISVGEKDPFSILRNGQYAVQCSRMLYGALVYCSFPQNMCAVPSSYSLPPAPFSPLFLAIHVQCADIRSGCIGCLAGNISHMLLSCFAYKFYAQFLRVAWPFPYFAAIRQTKYISFIDTFRAHINSNIS